jgi:hypothetical protein
MPPAGTSGSRGPCRRMRLCAARGGRMRLAVANTGARTGGLRRRLAVLCRGVRVAVVRLGRFEDSALGLFLLPCDALGVDTEQHVHGVACPLGYLGRVSGGVEPRGHGGVPKIIGTPCEKRYRFGFGECGGAGLVEDREIGAVGEDPAARQAEYAPAVAGAVFLEVVAALTGTARRSPPPGSARKSSATC